MHIHKKKHKIKLNSTQKETKKRMNFLVFEETKFNHELRVFMLEVDQGGWIPPCLGKMIPYRAWDDAHSL